jgi:hypothetical protein
MTDLFASPRVSLGRAKDHIVDLEKRIRAFLADTVPYTHVIEPDSEGINQVHKVKFIKLIPEEFAGITSDAVNNLRAVLDQIGYAIAVANGAKNPTKGTYFPFGETVSELDANIKTSCKKIPNEIVTLFRSFKPYKGGDNLLWALNRICVANKHRMLAPVGMACGGVHIISLHADRGPLILPALSWDRTKNEMVYAITGQDTKIEYKIDITFDVAFDEVEIVSGQPASAILRLLTSKVEGILLATEAEARRIGLIS